jgi:hypothetical protein
MDMEAERVSDRFDRVFWLGDMNYRVNGTRDMIDRLLKGNMHEVPVPKFWTHVFCDLSVRGKPGLWHAQHTEP